MSAGRCSPSNSLVALNWEGIRKSEQNRTSAQGTATAFAESKILLKCRYLCPYFFYPPPPFFFSSLQCKYSLKQIPTHPFVMDRPGIVSISCNKYQPCEAGNGWLNVLTEYGNSETNSQILLWYNAQYFCQ